jgi:hypothetical protein
MTSEPLLIEAAMSQFDVIIAEHIIVDADNAATFEAAKSLDFLSVRTPLLTASMFIRGLPARLHGKQPVVQQLLLTDAMGLPGWLLLGERPGSEIAFGAVGTFWRPTIDWRDVPQADFRDFDERGWGKLAASFFVAPYGDQTLLTYECRTTTTDPTSHRQFRRYWWLIRPFVRHIMRAALATIKANAEDAEPLR